MTDSISASPGSAERHFKREGEDSIKGRLLSLLRAKRMTQTEFTRLLGVSPTYIGAMRKSIPDDKMLRITEIFPDLNRDWLIYGHGDMFISIPEVDGGTSPVSVHEHLVPLLPIEAYAGNLQMWSEGVRLRDCEKIISPVPGVDFAIRISGNSMEPEFTNGSVVFIKQINERAFIPWGNPMVIDSENGVLIKLVYPVPKHPDAGADTYDDSVIEARSYNPAYPPVRIPTKSIFGMYRVVTAIRQYGTY